MEKSSKEQVDYTFFGECDSRKYIDSDSIVRIRTCEVDAAIRELNKAGYLMYRHLSRRTYRIRCSNKPLSPETHEGFMRIFGFYTNID
jgi:hypothetical protein